MRVIAGKYRGRHFDIPRTFKARPTTDFAKENLFNVLRSYVDFEDEAPRALDLFAGTGSITLELLSRGCSHVTAVELDSQHINLIRHFVQTLKADTAVTLLRADVLRFLRKAPGSYDFIFADPPYDLPELEQIPDLIFAETQQDDGVGHSLLTAGGLFVLEHGKKQDFSSHPHFIDHRSYGSVNFSLFR
ncbi:MAG: RsmD family RNA methyltransferase [Bacteroidaceae bacterium]|nr:RsmD family RNA methyltransferase [Bacteroidaceae bacterium]